ncbi:MAG: hypothetical protein RQ833_07045 [Sphingomonadaceae bacterium]|nr:hypothetical protein [Sphingomonadaceae bacterium]
MAVSGRRRNRKRSVAFTPAGSAQLPEQLACRRGGGAGDRRRSRASARRHHAGAAGDGDLRDALRLRLARVRVQAETARRAAAKIDTL